MSGPGPQPQAVALRSRRPLMSTCALAAAMVATGHARPALAGSGYATSDLRPVTSPSVALGGYNASINPTSATLNPSINYSGATGPTTANQPTINLTATNTVLGWTPTAAAQAGTGSVDFQTAGAVTTFIGPAGAGSYTVLNRILPTDTTRSITFSGTTSSYLNNGNNGAGAAGGNIWFYSPGGIVVGSTARFDVGSLLLSTDDVKFTLETGYGGVVVPVLDPNHIVIDGADGSQSVIDIRGADANGPGAVLNALGAGSYVAVVSPRINQAGTITANGSAALVAAEDATLTMASGLFNIEVTSGTFVPAGGNATTLTHSGTTGNQASAGGNSQAVYLVAVPKNQAVTMLVAGTLGYKAAVSARVVNGVVVLAAGSDANDGLGGSVTVDANGQGGNVAIGGGTQTTTAAGIVFHNATIASAATDATATPGSLGGLTFGGNLTLTAGHDASLTAAAGRTVSVAGNLTVTSRGALPDGTTRPGHATLAALYDSTLGGSTLTVTGDTLVDASVTGNRGEDATGGTASASFTDSAITLGALTVRARGNGGEGEDVDGGDGTGGNASITINGGTFSGVALTADAEGHGGNAFDEEGDDTEIGGFGRGGMATIALNGIALTLAGGVEVDADGQGGRTASQFGAVQGSGAGGTASLTTASRNNSRGVLVSSGLIAPTVLVTAEGHGYDGGEGSRLSDGGSGSGGSATLTSGSGTISAVGRVVNGVTLPGSVTVTAQGTGGGGSGANGGNAGAGGAGSGGSAIANATGGGISAATEILVTATGTGGEGGYDYESGYGVGGGNGGAGGFGTGGIAKLNVAGAAVAAPSVRVLADGDGGEGGSTGGGGGIGNAGGAGGGSQGGSLATIAITAGGSVVAPTLTVSAGATGGDGGEGDTAGGGGGNARGGTAVLTVTDSVATGNAILVDTSGTGGDGADSTGVDAGGAGGSGTGGSSTATAATDPVTPGSGGTITAVSLAVRSVGAGGGGGNHVEFGYGAGGAGGAGTGNIATLNVTRGSVAGAANGAAPAVTVTSDGSGGSAGDFINFGLGNGPAGAGGAGKAGTATATMGANAANRLTAGTLKVSAVGTGSNAGAGAGDPTAIGGAGTSGTAQLRTTGGVLSATTTQILASSKGGNGTGGNGGDALSTGSATVQAQDTNVSLGTYTIDGNAAGGNGGTAGNGVNSGNGGNAAAGGAVLSVTRGQLNYTGGINLNATAIGGSGGAAAGGGIGGIARFAIDSTALNANAGTAINIHADGQTGTTALTGRGAAGQGGTATLDIAGIATINPTIDISANGSGSQGGLTPGSGSGGTATFTASKSAANPMTTVTAGGTRVSIAAIGVGGNATVAGGFGGAGTGGTAAIVANGATITTSTGALLALQAQGTGGSAIDNGTGGAGTGRGTRVTITRQNGADGRIGFANALLDAGGTGGSVALSGSSGVNGGIGGAGTGGTALIDVPGGSFGSTTAPTAITISVAGNGGLSRTSGSGGAGTGGTATINMGSGGTAPTSGLVALAGLTVNGRGAGGTVTEDGYGIAAGGAGGAGTGGHLTTTNLGGTSSLSAAAVDIDMSGRGGAGGSSAGTNAGGAGGQGVGGTVRGRIDSATTYTADIRGLGGAGGASVGGNGGAGGSGIGGGAGGGLSVPAGVEVGVGTSTSVTVLANGQGGIGGASSAATGIGGAGGAATGGTAFVTPGTVSAALSVDASALGGNGGGSSGTRPTGAGGDARRGTASVTAFGTTRLGTLNLQATAKGGDSTRGVGGSALNSAAPAGPAVADGGVFVLANGSSGPAATLNVTGTVTLNALGTGGFGGVRGGNAFGGVADVTLRNGAFTFGGTTLTLGSQAAGGGSAATGIGGAAVGGNAGITADASTLAFAVPVKLDVSATGGQATTGASGAGTGGNATVAALNGATLSFNAAATGPTALSLDTRGTGAPGQTGGAGRGGTAGITATGATISVPGAVAMLATGTGGTGGGTGNGGAGTGGTGTITLLPTATRGGTVTLGTLAMNGNGVGGTVRGNGAFTPVSPTGTGGAGTGGGAILDARSGTLTVTGASTLSADGKGGDSQGGGAGGAGIGGGAAGSGTRGVSIATGGGAFAGFVELADVAASASGIGGTHIELGYGAAAGTGGGSGLGGSVAISAGSGGIDIARATMLANGTGGAGGIGTVGGNGGIGTGGTVKLASVSSTLSIGNADLQANGTGGAGGGGLAGNGGNGGAGIGGLAANGRGIAISVGGEGGTLAMGRLGAAADGTGGAGANGTVSAGGAGGSGGSGGNATGGDVLLTAVDGGSYTGLDGDGSAAISASASGGDAGTSTAGTTGGAGGNGGSATGGTAAILADRGSITIRGVEDAGPTLDADATGGNATAGSNGTMFRDGGSGGVGGSGGDGIGGTARITVTGGSLVAGTTVLSAVGISHFGQQGGLGAGTPAIPGDPTHVPPIPPVPEGPPTYAGGGNDGSAKGGLATIHVADQDDGELTGTAALGDTSINTGGSVDGFQFGDAGRVEIYDSSSATDSTLRLTSLDVLDYGYGYNSDQSVDIFADNARIGVSQFATIGAGGNIYFRANGTGGLDVGTSLIGQANGDIVVSHGDQREPRIDTITAGSIDLRAQNSIDAQAGSVLRAAGTLSLDADGSIDADRLYGGDLVSATARNSVRIDTAIASGAAFDGGEGGIGRPDGGRVFISGGFDGDAGGYNQSDVTVTGEIRAPGSVEIDAGQDLIVASGARVFSDNRVTLAAGDDILVRSGAEVRAALDPLPTANDDGPGETLDPAARLDIVAGRLPRRYDLATGEVASVIVDGTISAAARPLFLAGGAIVADANPIVARSLIVEVDGAPAPNATQLDDNGQLTRSDCLQGDVCVGTLQFDRLLSIGGALGTTAFLPTRLRIAGDATAQVTSLRARGDIRIGLPALPTDIGATVSGGDLLVQSTEGSIVLLGGSTLTGGDGAEGQFRVLAAGDVSGTTGGSLAAFGDAQLGIGGNLDVTGLSAGGGLVTLDQDGAVAADNQLSVGGGSIRIGTLSLGDGDANLIGPAGISVGTAEVANGRSIDFFSSGGLVELLSAGPSGRGTPADIMLRGQSVRTGNLTADNAITLTADAGGVNAGSLVGSTGVTLLSAAAIRLASASSDGTISLTSQGDIDAGPLDTDGEIDLTANGGAIRLDTARAGTTLNVHAGNSLSANRIDVGDDLLLALSGGITIGTATAGGSIALAGSNIALADGTAGADITLDGATIDVTRATAGDDFVATGGRVTLGTIATTGLGFDGGEGNVAGSNIIVDSTLGQTIASGNAAGDILLTSQGTIGATSLTAGRDVVATAAAPIDIAAIQAGDDILGDGTGDVRVLRATATGLGTDGGAGATGSNVAITARSGGTLTTGPVSATGDVTLTSLGGGAIMAGATSGRDVTANASGTLTLASATATRDIALSSVGALTAGPLVAAGNVGLNAIGGLITLDTVRVGGTFNVTAGTALTAGAITVGTDLVLNLAGPIDIGTATAGGSILLTGASVMLDDGTAGRDIALTATSGGIGAGQLMAGGAVTASAQGPIDIAGIQAVGDVVVDGSGNVQVGGAAATGLDLSTLGVPGHSVTITARNGGTLTTGDVSATRDVTLTSLGGGAILAGALRGGNVTAHASGALTLARADATQGISLAAIGPIHAGPLVAAGTIALTAAGGNITLDTATAGGTLSVDDGLAFFANGLAIGGDLSLSLAGPITIGALNVAGNASARSSVNDVAIGTATVGGDLVLGAGDVTGSGSANLTLGTATAGTALLAATGRIDLTGTLTTTRGDARLRSGGNIDGGDILTYGTFDAASDTGAIAIGTVTAGNPTGGGGIALAAQTGIATHGLQARNSILVNSAAGPVATQDLESSGGSARLFAGGNMIVGNVRTAGSIFLTGTAAITAGNLTAGTGPLLATEQGSSGGGAGGSGAAPAGIAAGFDELAIQRCDDCFTSAVPLPFNVSYFGRTYSNTFVSNNGYLTFNSGQGQYTPGGLGTGYSGQPIVAAFFADVDTRNPVSALTTYGTGTFAGRQAFGATWNGVGYYSNQADKLNRFQLVLTDRSDTGAGNFDIYYNYTNIAWETGSASSGVNGFGGISAAVGYNAGTGNQTGTFFELAGSRVPGSLLNGGPMPLVTGTNDGVPGQLMFSVRNGQVSSGGTSEPPTIHVTNIAAGNSADITLGNLSAEAAEVHGAGRVTVGNVNVADLGSGAAGAGQRFATVLDATSGLLVGDIVSTGLVAIGASAGNVATGAITTAGSAVVLASGTVVLGPVGTGRGAGDSLFISGPGILGSDRALAGFAFNTLLSSRSFDPIVLAGLRPTRIGGTITLNGPISTGNFLAAAQGGIGFSPIDAATRIFIGSGTDVTVGDLTSGIIEIEADGSVRTGNLVGNAAARTARFTAIGIDSGGSATVGNVTTAAGDIDIDVDGGIGAGALSAGDSVRLLANAAISTGALTGGTLGGGGAAIAGYLGSVGAATFGNVTVGAVNARNDIALATGGTLTTGGLVAGDAIALVATGNIALASAAAGGLLYIGNASVLGTINIGEDLELEDLPAVLATTPIATGGRLTIAGAASAASIRAAIGGDVAAASLVATQSIALDAGGNFVVPVVTAGTTLALNAGSILIDRATAGGNADLAASRGTLTVTTNIGAGGTVNARGTAVTLNGQGPLSIDTATATAGNLGIATVGALNVAAAQAPGTIRLTSSAGGVTVQNASTLLTAGQTASGRGDIIVNAALDARLNGSVTARDDVGVTAAQTATLNGLTTGTNVALASADVAVGAAATVGGGMGTTSVTFTNNRSGTLTFIGDTAGTGGYRLDNAEFGRIRAQTIRIGAPGSTTAGDTPDVTIGTLTIGGSATGAGQTGQAANLFGSAAGLFVTTPGTLRVAGNVRLVSAGAGDRIDLSAGPRLDMITPDGTLTITDAGNAPAGTLGLSANTVIVSSTAAAQALATLTTLDEKSDRFGTNDGPVKPEGFIQAGGIVFRVGSGLFVQNSGVSGTNGRQPDMRAGLTVGSGGISIVATGTAAPQIAINGRQSSATATGGFVTGRALIPVLTIGASQGTVSFDPRSTANGCLILGQSCGFDGTSVPPIQDVINQFPADGATDDGTGGVQAFNVPIIELIDIDTFGFAPSIDDPVTGAGNDDLWTSDCTDVSAQNPCPQPPTGAQPTN